MKKYESSSAPDPSHHTEIINKILAKGCAGLRKRTVLLTCFAGLPLMDWLMNSADLIRELTWIAADADIAASSRSLRHSYGAYRYCQTGDLVQVTRELGRPIPTALHRLLLLPVTDCDAAVWFSV